VSAVVQPQPIAYAPTPSRRHDEQETLRLPLGKAILLAVLVEGLMLAALGYFFSREAAPKPPVKITELVEMAPPKMVDAVQPEPKPQPVVKQQVTPSPPKPQPTPTPIAKSAAPSPIATPPVTPPAPVSPPVNAAPAPTPPPVAAPAKPAVQPPNAGSSDIVAVNRSKPNYPRRAIQAGLEGWVKLSFTVTADGQVKDIKVLDSNPPRLFDDEAMRAIQQWTFKPRKQDGKAVEGTAIQTVEFKLSDL
jgi:protein TonB